VARVQKNHERWRETPCEKTRGVNFHGWKDHGEQYDCLATHIERVKRDENVAGDEMMRKRKRWLAHELSGHHVAQPCFSCAGRSIVLDLSFERVQLIGSDE
jgi:hypothetical protein